MVDLYAGLGGEVMVLGSGKQRDAQGICQVLNLKVQRDYFNAMEVIIQQTACARNSGQSTGASG
ncbi:MAG: hypothetical protein A2Z43_00300 [Syntrophobacterales bacterium RBG_19FT_COMBO_59_10]|nr:MAG: hypothetical protein A2Z43_00300 [Syntrophobacterales bacterium RBG_19FT_COMBO_59_10]